MKNILKGKKLLILGGAHQHRKIVEAAKSLGVETYVTDYLPFEESPAKQMADHGYMYNITDYDALVELCKKEHIDGVIAPYLDVTQMPYQEMCERMGWPCFGNKEQHRILTSKKAFKKFCEEHGADVIPYYSENDIVSNCDFVQYPVLIKPSDSRGSRGQTVCYNHEEALSAIDYAKSESYSGDIIVEKYMGQANDIQLVYLVIDEVPILVRVEDRYLGGKDTGLDKLSIASINSSRFETEYREKADAKVKEMIKAIELKNSPVFIQAFMDGDVARLYDPGIRLPGDNYDIAYKFVTGIDMAKLMVEFALTGKMSAKTGKQIEDARIDKATAMIQPGLRPGIIKEIIGLEEIMSKPEFLYMSQAYKVGDTVKLSNNVKQRFAEFVIACENYDQLIASIDWMFETLKVIDENGNDMIFAKFDTNLLKAYK